MKEANIKCLSAQYTIEDLNLQLLRGDVQWLSEDRAKGSKDLALGVSVGAISLSWVERCATNKQPVLAVKPVPVPTKPTVPAVPKVVRPPRVVEDVPLPAKATGKRTKK